MHRIKIAHKDTPHELSYGGIRQPFAIPQNRKKARIASYTGKINAASIPAESNYYPKIFIIPKMPPRI
jgi:hypothetical protein